MEATGATEDDIIVEFKSLGEYKRFAVEHKDFDDCNKLSSMNKGMHYGSTTYDTFLDLLDSGDEDVMKKIKVATDKEVNSLAKKYKEVINNYKFDVTGEFFDVGLVLTGVPETWLQPEHEEEEMVQVELIIDGAFHVGVDKDKIVKNGARILAMVKLLETMHVQVKIRIVSSNRRWKSRDNSMLYVSTLIKDYDEPINYKKVSAIISPTYHRRGTFKVIEVLAGHRVGRGYGQPVDTNEFIQLHDNWKIDNLEARLFKGK